MELTYVQGGYMTKRAWNVIVCGMLMSVCCATCAAPTQLTLFGTPLKGETRAQLRQVFKVHGMVPTREDENYWVDEYDPGSVLDGASKFSAGYVAATHVFAYAEYEFSGSMDTELVAKVIAMVQSKYGAPSSRTGNIAVGEVTATWDFPNGMVIHVSRGWPDTTTYIDYVDIAARKAMHAEMAAEKQRQALQSSQSQNSAF